MVPVGAVAKTPAHHGREVLHNQPPAFAQLLNLIFDRVDSAHLLKLEKDQMCEHSPDNENVAEANCEAEHPGYSPTGAAMACNPTIAITWLMIEI